MKATAWITVRDENEFVFLEKIIDLGYEPIHVFRSAILQVYRVDMTEEDLTMLKISVPYIEIQLHT